MKAPKEIYVPLVDMGVEDGGIQPAPIWWNKDKSMEKQDCKGAVKYVRADIAELTWEDIWKIWDIIEQVKNDFCDNPQIFKLKEVTPENFKRAYGEEVLRRFLESKRR